MQRKFKLSLCLVFFGILVHSSTLVGQVSTSDFHDFFSYKWKVFQSKQWRRDVDCTRLECLNKDDIVSFVPSSLPSEGTPMLLKIDGSREYRFGVTAAHVSYKKCGINQSEKCLDNFVGHFYDTVDGAPSAPKRTICIRAIRYADVYHDSKNDCISKLNNVVFNTSAKLNNIEIEAACDNQRKNLIFWEIVDGHEVACNSVRKFDPEPGQGTANGIQ